MAGKPLIASIEKRLAAVEAKVAPKTITLQIIVVDDDGIGAAQERALAEHLLASPRHPKTVESYDWTVRRILTGVPRSDGAPLALPAPQARLPAPDGEADHETAPPPLDGEILSPPPRPYRPATPLLSAPTIKPFNLPIIYPDDTGLA